MKNDTIANKITYVLFIIYLLVLIWIILLKLGVQFSYVTSRSVNLIPFYTLLTSTSKIDVGELILNVLIFVPLGIYIGVLFKNWTFGTKLFCIFFTSLLFEALQFILKIGAFDSTDIITNVSGGLVGLLIFKGIEKAFHDSSMSQKIINIIAMIGTALMLSLLIMLKLNLLPIKYQ